MLFQPFFLFFLFSSFFFLARPTKASISLVSRHFDVFFFLSFPEKHRFSLFSGFSMSFPPYHSLKSIDFPCFPTFRCLFLPIIPSKASIFFVFRLFDVFSFLSFPQKHRFSMFSDFSMSFPCYHSLKSIDFPCFPAFRCLFLPITELRMESPRSARPRLRQSAFHCRSCP